MALRIVTIEATESRQDIRTPLQGASAAAIRSASSMQAPQAGIAGGRLGELRSLLAEISEWTEPDRSYEGRCAILTEVAFASSTPTLQEPRWLALLLPDRRRSAARRARGEPVRAGAAQLRGRPALRARARSAIAALALPRRHASRSEARPRRRRTSRQAQAVRRKPGYRNSPLDSSLDRGGRASARREGSVIATSRRGRRPSRGMTVSLCMIVKDEEEMLPGCLEAVASAVDELIIVDTGSSDRTVEIAESFGARVLRFPWNGSFSDARNVGLEAASGDWLLYLDADEHLVPDDAPKLRSLLGKTWREGFHLVETNYTGGDDSGAAVTHLALRIFRNRPDYRFEGRIHEQKTGNMPTWLGERFETTAIRIRHFGYLKSRVQRPRGSRGGTSSCCCRRRRTREEPAFEARLQPRLRVHRSRRVGPRCHAPRQRLVDPPSGVELARTGLCADACRPVPARAARSRRPARRLCDARGLPRRLSWTYTELLVLAGRDAPRDEREYDAAAALAERCLELGDPPTKYMHRRLRHLPRVLPARRDPHQAGRGKEDAEGAVPPSRSSSTRTTSPRWCCS